MNYYPRHIGDYMRDAGHLTMLEHGAYTLLLDIYYASEQGISDNNHLHKSLGAKSKDEKAAIDYVLNRFFSLKNGIWVNKRAEKEIKKSRKRISLSQSNGRRGGRPKSEENNEKIEEKNPIRRKPNASAASSITQREPSGNPAGYQKKPSGLKMETQIKANQKPKAKSQKPKGFKNNARAPEATSFHEEICVALEAQGVDLLDIHHKKIGELIKKGATIHNFLNASEIAKKNGKGVFYVFGIVEKSVSKQVQTHGNNLKNIALGVNEDGSF